MCLAGMLRCLSQTKFQEKIGEMKDKWKNESDSPPLETLPDLSIGESLAGTSRQSSNRLSFVAKQLQSDACSSSPTKSLGGGEIYVHAHYNFGPLSAYLSVNYLDRFLSTYELPQGKAWMTQLLSVACLSLAAKMEETEVPLLLDFQVGESKYVFEARTVQRMELLVLSTLKWKMQAVTPFSFIDYFLHKFNDGNSPTKLLISRSTELILNTVRGTDFLAFRPSEIAAAVALSVLGETQTVDAEKGVSCCIHIAKERVLGCYEVIQENVLMRNRPLKNASPTVSSVPRSPVAVLDAACLSYKSDGITVGSQSTCHHPSPASKRRKISTSSIP